MSSSSSVDRKREVKLGIDSGIDDYDLTDNFNLENVLINSKVSMNVNTYDLESSIKAFCDNADLHLEKLHDLHNDNVTRPLHHKTPSSGGGNYTQEFNMKDEWNHNSHSNSNVNRRANASMNALSSTKINTQNTPHLNTSGNNSNNNNNNSHSNSNNSNNSNNNNHNSNLDMTIASAAESTLIARKIDLMMRRQRVLEERVKESQHNNERLIEDFAVQSELIKKMAETHKNDRRLIGLLSEQVQSLKNDRELDFQQLQSTRRSLLKEDIESIIDAKIGKAMAINSIDFEQVKSQLKEQLQKNIAIQLRISVENIIKEQQIILSKWTEQYNANLSIQITLGKEISNFQESIKSIAIRQSNSDTSLAKFSESLLKQDERINSVLNGSIDVYRKEMQNVLDSVGRKINDHVTTLTKDVNSLLSSSFEKYDEKFEYINKKNNDENTIIQAISRRLTQLEIDQKDGISQVNSKINNTLTSVVKTESYINKFINNFEEIESKISLLKFEITEAEAASRKVIDSIVESVEGTRAFCDSSIQMLSNSYSGFEEMTTMAVQEAVGRIEAFQNLPKQNADGLASLKSLIDDKFTMNSDELESYKEELSRTVSTLFESDKKTRIKIKEIYDQYASVSQTRSAVDRVLHEVNERSKEDSVWTYHFKNLAETLDSRLKSVEKMIPQSLRSLQERIFDIENKVTTLRNNNNRSSSQNDQTAITTAVTSLSSQSHVELNQIQAIRSEMAAAMQEMVHIRNDIKLFLEQKRAKNSISNENAFSIEDVESIISNRLNDYEKRLLIVEGFIVRTSDDIMNDLSDSDIHNNRNNNSNNNNSSNNNNINSSNNMRSVSDSLLEVGEGASVPHLAAGGLSSSSKASALPHFKAPARTDSTITISNTHLNTIMNTKTNTHTNSNPIVTSSNPIVTNSNPIVSVQTPNNNVTDYDRQKKEDMSLAKKFNLFVKKNNHRERFRRQHCKQG